jgi:aryl-alcohol dehydrogenase-like predicted oxidoreductase
MLDPTDWRLTGTGRFSEENFDRNADVALKFSGYAEKKGCTGAQLSLAWLLSKGINSN